MGIEENMRIKDLCKEAHRIARIKGFWGIYGQDLETHRSYYVHDRNQAEMLCLMHSGISEALEAIRSKDESKNNVGEELSDCCIRIFDYCGAFENEQLIILMKHNKDDFYFGNRDFSFFYYSFYGSPIGESWWNDYIFVTKKEKFSLL